VYNIFTGSIQNINDVKKDESKSFWFDLKKVECKISLKNNILSITATKKLNDIKK